MDRRNLNEILREIDVAKKKWKAGELKEKPEILLLGPKPLHKKQEEPVYPIFPVQETRSKGKNYRGERKIKLIIIEDSIASIKERIATEKVDKEKDYLKKRLIELETEFDITLKEIREYKKLEKAKKKNKRH